MSRAREVTNLAPAEGFGNSDAEAASRDSTGDSRLRTATTAAPGLAAVAALIVLVEREGGFATTTFLPVALFFVALLAVVIATLGVATRGRRDVTTALVLLAAFTAWEAASVAWADVKGDAWDGANRAILYLAVYAVFAVRPWRPAVAGVLVSIYSIAVAGVALAAFLAAAAAGDPAGRFIAGRFAEPIDYPNATAALLLAAVWPALYLAARRELPALARGVMLASAGISTQLALMAQSRGSLVAVPVVAIVLVALAPDRLRLVLAGVPVAVSVFLASPTLLDVYPAVVSGEGTAAALSAARDAVLVSAAALFGLGLAVGLADRRLAIPSGVSRVAGALLAAAAALVAVGALVLTARGDPIAEARDAWTEFQQGERRASDSHLTSGLGSQRYDVWRVAVGEFRSSPLVGIGSDNFAGPYLRHRRADQEPLYPHSVQLKVLSQTGLIGAMLFAAFLVVAVAAAWRSTRVGSPFARGLAASALAAFAYWFVHGSIDWFWEIPALGAPAFAWLALAAGTRPSEPQPGGEAGGRPLLAGVLALSLVAAASTLSPWIAAKEVEVAATSWAADPDTAFARLDRARRLNPLSDDPDIVAGIIAARIGDPARHQEAFRQVLDRNPLSWYAHLELAMSLAQQGRRRAALAHLREAADLNPREPILADVRRLVSRGEEVRPAEIRQVFRRRIVLLTGERQR